MKIYTTIKIKILHFYYYYNHSLELRCPSNSTYKVSAEVICSNTCASTAVTNCASGERAEGCFCDNGYTREGNACVASSQCGCFYKGNYQKVGRCTKRFLQIIALRFILFTQLGLFSIYCAFLFQSTHIDSLSSMSSMSISCCHRKRVMNCLYCQCEWFEAWFWRKV